MTIQEMIYEHCFRQSGNSSVDTQTRKISNRPGLGIRSFAERCIGRFGFLARAATALVIAMGTWPNPHEPNSQLSGIIVALV
jgi:hypothetical protein